MKKKTPKIYCCDFETTSKAQYLVEGRTRVYLWKLMSIDEKEDYYNISMLSFFEKLKEFKRDALIYFHNLSFDGEFINWYLLENGYEYDEERTKPKTFSSIIDETGSIYSITIKLETEITIDFRCSYKLFPMSIEKIGTIVGVTKLKETHNYEELKNYNSVDELPKEELSYIHNDVLIMVKFIKYLRQMGISGMTMSSSAYKNWKKEKYQLCKYQMKKDTNEEIVEIVRKSYRGGITKVNNKYAGVDIYDAISFDVNSLYPSVMYQNVMPIGEGKIFSNVEECLNEHRYAYIVVVVVTTAKIKEGYHAFIGNQSGFSYARQYSYDDYLENKVLYLWGKEFNLFKMCYEGQYAISKVVGWKTAKYVFKDYIDRWYHLKETTTNPVEKQLAKLMLNSLYGKFGMNDTRISKMPVGCSEDKILYESDETSCVYYYKEVASYITSLARCKLVTFMQMCGDDFIYCDTDSLYLKGHDIPDHFLPVIDDKKLGFWKYEGHYKHFRAWKAKCYLKQLDNDVIERKIAGCPKECASLINFDNFYPNVELKNCKKVKKKVRGGIIIDTTHFKIHIERKDNET